MSKKAQSRLAKVRAYKQVFSTAAGQRVLHDMMDAHHMLYTSFNANPYEAAFREGGRNAVLRILTILNEDPKKLEERIQAMEAARAEENEE